MTLFADPATRYLLPPEAYYDRAWFDREQSLVFERTWNLVAYTSDIARPGDYVTAMIGRTPVVIVRDEHGVIRAFVNMCRHRGMALVDGAGCAGERIKCPYHFWEFGLDGSLQRVPQRSAQFPDLDLDRWGLVPCAVGTWAGMVFAHLDADATSGFTDWLGEYPTEAFVGDFPWDDLVEIGRVRYPLACNWKLYIENHVDIYHLWYLHEESLGMFDHPALTCRSTGAHWACDERLRPGMERARPTLRPIEPLTELEYETLRANLLFPNVPMTTSNTLVNTYQVIPTGPTTCELDLRVRAMPGGVFDEALSAGVRSILVDEDGRACEQLQRNVASPWFSVGPLAQRHERPIVDFQSNVLAALR
jgi:Rieske 2Fe-2S family protein